MLIAQLLSSGVLGPRMLCSHRDGSHSIEWAATVCCGGGRSHAAAESECTGCTDACHEQHAGQVLSQPDCDCIDTPIAGEPMLRQAPQAAVHADLVSSFVAIVSVLVIDLVPVDSGGFAQSADLPQCLAPPRAHLATIVLRL